MSVHGIHTRPHAGESNCWLTPPCLIRALGTFDLDPCFDPPRPWDTARRHIGWPQHGLHEPWGDARVWLNPPFGPEAGKWLAKLADHGNGVALIMARTETRWWFESIWPRATAVLFLRGRLHFHRPDGTRSPMNCGAPLALVAYGENNARSLAESDLDGALVYLTGSEVTRDDCFTPSLFGED